MNLLVVDDHALFREGLRALLDNIDPDLSITEAASVEIAVGECQAIQFRMVLLDLGLAATGGIETLEHFRHAVPDISVIVLSGDQEPRHIRAAIDLGAVGFIPKSHTSELMIAALRFVLAGGIYLPLNVLGNSIHPDPSEIISANKSTAFGRLSARQHEVAELLLQGTSNKLIARRLALSEGTVKAHVSAIFQVIGVKNRVEAVIIAARSGVKVM